MKLQWTTFQHFTIGTVPAGGMRDRMVSAGGGKLAIFMTKAECGNYCRKLDAGNIAGGTGCKI